MAQSIAVIDMKSFYASVECVDRKLNPFTTPLAVCDPDRGDGTVVMSVTPYLKSLGYPSVCRRRDLSDVEGLILAKPRMATYIKKSAEILSIVLDYIAEDDIHVYSIDEFFVNLGPYLKMYECTPRELTIKLQKAISKQTGLVTTAGVSYNMLMAKLALDLDGKKKPPYIAVWTKKDIPNKLWKVTPLSKMWGINVGYETRLNAMGIFTVGQLANTDKNFLKERLGVMGEQLWEHANGIDNTNIRDKYVPKETSLSLGQVLYKDYNAKEARLIVKEMNDDLCMRLREQGQKTKRVGLMIGYSASEGGGFSHQTTLDYATDDTEVILQDLLEIFDKYISRTNKIRRVYLTFGKLTEEQYDQLSLFEDAEESKDRKTLQKVSDELKKMYGKDIVLKASSLLEESTAKERHQQIGGHHK